MGLAQDWACGVALVLWSGAGRLCLVADRERYVFWAILFSRLIRASILASMRLFGGCGKRAEKALSTTDVYQHDIQL